MSENYETDGNRVPHTEAYTKRGYSFRIYNTDDRIVTIGHDKWREHVEATKAKTSTYVNG